MELPAEIQEDLLLRLDPQDLVQLCATIYVHPTPFGGADLESKAYL